MLAAGAVGGGPCAGALAVEGGLRVAADYEVRVFLDGEPAGIVYASPSMLGEMAAGLALRLGLAPRGTVAGSLSVEQLAGERLVLRASLDRPRAPVAGPVDRVLPWELVAEAYRRFIGRVSKKRCPYAVHAYAVYLLDPRGAGIVGEELVVDVSRHTAALKAAGLVSGLARSGGARGLAAVAVTTGRVSGDAVEAMAAAGVKVIVSNHHPVLSGLRKAKSLGVTLLLRHSSGRGLAAYTSPSRVRGAPVAPGAAAAAAAGPAHAGGPAAGGVVSPLC